MSEIEKKLKARIIQKHDIENNWEKATNFIPKQGEIIVYDDDLYPRIKIGDNARTVSNLPFMGFDELGITIQKMTKQEYTALTLKDPETLYIITDTDPIEKYVGENEYHFMDYNSLNNTLVFDKSKYNYFNGKYEITGETYQHAIQTGPSETTPIFITPIKYLPSDETSIGLQNIVDHIQDYFDENERGGFTTEEMRIKNPSGYEFFTSYDQVMFMSAPDSTDPNKNSQLFTAMSKDSGLYLGFFTQEAIDTIGIFPPAEIKPFIEGYYIIFSNNIYPSIGEQYEITFLNADYNIKTLDSKFLRGLPGKIIYDAYNNPLGEIFNSEYNNVQSEYSHAEGENTSVGWDGRGAHAEGSYTKADGSGAHAEGSYTKADGSGAHAEGSYTNANGSASHAEGSNTWANGESSHAEGRQTRVEQYGSYSHAEGIETKVSGKASHVEGSYTIAEGDNMHVEGKYNTLPRSYDEKQKYVHIVGNGYNEESRSNAHTLDWDGNAWYAGVISQEGTPKANNDLITVKYFNDNIENSYRNMGIEKKIDYTHAIKINDSTDKTVQVSWSDKNLIYQYLCVDYSQYRPTGITCTKGPQGELIINGTATDKTPLKINTFIYESLLNQPLCLSGSIPDQQIIVSCKTPNHTYTDSTGNGVVLSTYQSGQYYNEIYISIPMNVPFKDFAIYPQLEPGTQKTTFSGDPPHPHDIIHYQNSFNLLSGETKFLTFWDFSKGSNYDESRTWESDNGTTYNVSMGKGYVEVVIPGTFLPTKKPAVGVLGSFIQTELYQNTLYTFSFNKKQSNMPSDTQFRYYYTDDNYESFFINDSEKQSFTFIPKKNVIKIAIYSNFFAVNTQYQLVNMQLEVGECTPFDNSHNCVKKIVSSDNNPYKFIGSRYAHDVIIDSYASQGFSGFYFADEKIYIDQQDEKIKQLIPTKTSELLNDNNFITKAEAAGAYHIPLNIPAEGANIQNLDNANYVIETGGRLFNANGAEIILSQGDFLFTDNGTAVLITSSGNYFLGYTNSSWDSSYCLTADEAAVEYVEKKTLSQNVDHTKILNRDASNQHPISAITGLQAVLDTTVKLDPDTQKISSNDLPSYVDDVIEAENKSAFPSTGESGKIYIDLSTSLTYRWGGSAYVEISPSLALGETASTAYAGDKGAALKTAVDDHIKQAHVLSGDKIPYTIKISQGVIPTVDDKNIITFVI